MVSHLRNSQFNLIVVILASIGLRIDTSRSGRAWVPSGSQMVRFTKVKPRMGRSMARAGSSMLTAIFIKVIGRMENPTDTGSMSTLKAQFTKALGSTTCMMEKA